MAVEYKVEVNDPKIGWVHVNGAFEFLTYSWFVSLEEAQTALRNMEKACAAHGVSNEYRICKRTISPWEVV